MGEMRLLRTFTSTALALALALALASAAGGCGGKIAGENDPTATWVSGTKADAPTSPAPPPADAPPPHPTPVSPPAEAPGAPTNGTAPFPWASSCSVAPPADAGPRPPPADGQRAAFLEALRSDMVGHWFGTANTPWEPLRTYSVFLAFEADGHYATRSLAPTGEAAFYYGTDLDTPLKQWALTDLTAGGVGSGTIDIAFFYGSSFGLPVWNGELHDVTIDPSGDRLRLSFSTSDGYGPVVFDVWRCGQ